jgi:lipopolysaccharide export system permease protein
MSRSDIQLFATNKIMRNLDELSRDLDSLRREQESVRKYLYANYLTYFSYFHRPAGALTLDKPAITALEKKLTLARNEKATAIHDQRLSQIRSFQSFSESYLERLKNLRRDVDVFSVEKYRKYTQSAACLVLFLVGAPLGSIIKKGGFGIPVLISIVFFILYYIFSITGEKWSKENVVDVPQGMWASNVILLGAGLYFLRKAWKDSTLLDNNYLTRALQAAGALLSRLRRKGPDGSTLP